MLRIMRGHHAGGGSIHDISESYCHTSYDCRSSCHSLVPKKKKTGLSSRSRQMGISPSAPSVSHSQSEVVFPPSGADSKHRELLNGFYSISPRQAICRPAGLHFEVELVSSTSPISFIFLARPVFVLKPTTTF